ncbi:peptidylprolyl isomerase [Caldicellulosiruptor acetigenus]|jgi:foldase protein PrsA|uniref:peptidylprolyl isomerase n=1 Tax=Caldicellulosiruptor acetigenus 6A TaxID=632516 RepID=G2PXH7_9FIRM|nr:peptidylprolyl isomerase [Caldicellulosiruptor acetigenus]AEM74841.1 PpiC-type peptidyl-prolyl cis-trans isomerase [Caldicellulosiruptor acetigenus 6A]
MNKILKTVKTHKIKIIGVVGFIVAILVAMFFVFSSSLQTVLEINNEKINKKEFLMRYNILKQNAIEMSNRPDILDIEYSGMKYKDWLKNKVIELLITETLCLQEAKKRGMKLTFAEEQEVNNYINNIKNDKYAREMFYEYLKKIKSNEELFKKQLLRERLIDKLYKEITKNVTLKEQEMKQYYENNKNEYRMVKVVDIFLRVENEQQKAEKEKLANQLMAKIKNGGSIFDLAQKYSEITTKNGQKGVIDYFRKGEKESEFGSVFEEKVFNLKKGEISEIIQTLNGYHIAQIIDEKFAPYESVKGEIEQSLKKQKKDKVFQEYLNELRKKSVIKEFRNRIATIN